MEYTCLKCVNKGFVLTRKPEMIEKELIVSFLGSPPDATAIFRNGNGDSIYRLLSDNSCVIPADFLDGETKVTLTVLNGKTPAQKYDCEPICAERKNGVLLVYPNWLDLPKQIIEIYGEIQKIKNEMETSSRKHDDLNRKVDKLLDGYDFD